MVDRTEVGIKNNGSNHTETKIKRYIRFISNMLILLMARFFFFVKKTKKNKINY